MRRSFNYVSFAATAAVIGTPMIPSADVMYVFHPPTTMGLPAALWRAVRRVPFVYDVQDIWPETIVADGMLRSPALIRLLAKLEKAVYRLCPAIIVQTPGARRNLMEKGVPETKIHVLPNWSDEALYRPVPPDHALASKEGMAGKFNVVFAGNLGGLQALHVVVDAAARLAHLPDVQFVVIGDGGERAALERDSVARGLTNVRFIGRRPVEQMAAYFSIADALLVHLMKRELFSYIVPSKTSAYMACGRPILMGVRGDAAALVEENGAGIAFEPEDGAALAEAVQRLRDMPAAQREQMGAAALDTFRRTYARSVLIPKYESVLRMVARVGRRADGSGTHAASR